MYGIRALTLDGWRWVKWDRAEATLHISHIGATMSVSIAAAERGRAVLQREFPELEFRIEPAPGNDRFSKKAA